jgi:hypothetical protein
MNYHHMPPLVNAEKRSKEFTNFHIPSRKRREAVKVDDLAQAIFDGNDREEERVWLKVVKIHKDDEGIVYLGVAEHSSKYTDCCDKGMSVEFRPEHVIAIMQR